MIDSLIHQGKRNSLIFQGRRNDDEMLGFFQEMIDKFKIHASSVEIDKEKILIDDKYEKIVKIIKGATLTTEDELVTSKSFFVRSTSSLLAYHLFMTGLRESESSPFPYSRLSLQRLESFPELHTIRRGDELGEAQVPKENVPINLTVIYELNKRYGPERYDLVPGDGIMEIREDPLMARFYDFLTK